MFARFFIRRPIFAVVLSILVTLGGIVGLLRLSTIFIRETTPTIIEVYTIYPGADLQTLADTVVAPIEEEVNGVENMMHMSSTSTNDGGYTLIITFKPGTDPNIALVLVQNRMNLAMSRLPTEVKCRGIRVKKKSQE